MEKSFGQFCPVALASEVLTQKWMLLVIRELMVGTTRFNDIRRGVPKISPTLLKQRLDTLESAEIVTKKPVGEFGHFEYILTQAGKELKEVLFQIGGWGQRWARDINDEDLDPGWLVWNMHRRLDIAAMPQHKIVIHFEFSDAKQNERFFWLVKHNGKVEVCLKNPGFPLSIKVRTTIRVLGEVWRGIRSINKEIDRGSIILEGDKVYTKAFPDWLLLSIYAPIKSKRKRT